MWDMPSLDSCSPSLEMSCISFRRLWWPAVAAAAAAAAADDDDDDNDDALSGRLQQGTAVFLFFMFYICMEIMYIYA